jgi:hypothetical protein
MLNPESLSTNRPLSRLLGRLMCPNYRPCPKIHHINRPASMARCILQPLPNQAGLGRRQTHKFSCRQTTYNWIWFPAHRTPGLCTTTRKVKMVTRWLSVTGEGEISTISVFSLRARYPWALKSHSPDCFIALTPVVYSSVV